MNQVEKPEKVFIEEKPDIEKKFVDLVYDWEMRIGRLKRTKDLIDYLGKDQPEGTRIRCNWEDVKRELNARDIEDRSFLITLREHLGFLRSKGYPEIQAHRKKLRTYADMICDFEWIKIAPEPPISLKCVKVTAEEVKKEAKEDKEEELPVIIGGVEWPWKTIPLHIREQLREQKKKLKANMGGIEGTFVADYPEEKKEEEKKEEEKKEEEKKNESGG